MLLDCHLARMPWGAVNFPGAGVDPLARGVEHDPEGGRRLRRDPLDPRQRQAPCPVAPRVVEPGMTIFNCRVLAAATIAATAVLASAGAASADSVGNNLPGLGLLSQSFGNGDQQHKAADTLPTHNALNNVKIP